MSESNDPKTDQLKDRLLEQALSEVLGEDRPPDLSAQILDAAAQRKLSNSRPEKKEQVMSGAKKTNGRFWAILATAACLMITVGGVAWYMMPAINSAKESKRVAVNFVKLKNAPQSKRTDGAYSYIQSEQLPDKWADDQNAPQRRPSAKAEVRGRMEDAEVMPEELWVTDQSNNFALVKKLAVKPKTDSPKYENYVAKTAPTLPQKSPSDEIVRAFPKLKELQEAPVSSSQSAGKAKPQYSKEYSQKARKMKEEVAQRPQSELRVVTKHLRQLQDAPKGISRAAATKTTREPLRSLKSIRSLEADPFGGGTLITALRGRPQNPSLRTPVEIAREIVGEGNFSLVPDSRGQPGHGGDKYSQIVENPFQTTAGTKALSTFSIDVDTASYANVRKFLLDNHRLPPPGAVRIEELINYFDYNYEASTGDVPFAVHVEVAGCPWKPGHRLVRVALKGKEIEVDKRPVSNLVFLLDVSGSMSSADKLPLVKHGIAMLVQQLGENDRVAIVVYAGSTGLVLPSTLGDEKEKITAVLSRLHAAGSTAGGAGIQLAYKIAKDHFVGGGVNRVILCTDGDFNVGTSDTASLEKLVAQKAKDGTFLTVLGFGRGNLNDEMMERISNKGNGNYHYIDSLTEARKVLVDELSGTLVTIAKDVKIQIEFNPAKVAAYRLIGYENRMLAAKDFKDDKKDAGEIGAGHKVTALYEIVPAGVALPGEDVIELKYQKTPKVKVKKGSKELLTLRLRYKKPDGEKSTKIEFPITDSGKKFSRASKDFKFASAVASFGMLLRNSKHKGESTYASVLEIAAEGQYPDKHGYRSEFLQMVRQAKQLSGQ